MLNITTPVTLEGSAVSLEPLRRDHAGLFWEAARDGVDEIFRWIPYAGCATPSISAFWTRSGRT